MSERVARFLAALCFAAAAVCVGLAASVFSQRAQAQEAAGRLCDVDFDGDVDRADVVLVRAGIGWPAAAGDPRDANLDGRITINDVRICTLSCTRAGCAEF